MAHLWTICKLLLRDMDGARVEGFGRAHAPTCEALEFRVRSLDSLHSLGMTIPGGRTPVAAATALPGVPCFTIPNYALTKVVAKIEPGHTANCACRLRAPATPSSSVARGWPAGSPRTVLLPRARLPRSQRVSRSSPRSPHIRTRSGSASCGCPESPRRVHPGNR
jgi:hypothetical protein